VKVFAVVFRGRDRQLSVDQVNHLLLVSHVLKGKHSNFKFCPVLFNLNLVIK
jgi:hypothetical protein